MTRTRRTFAARSRRGFTLIEILLVLALLGMLVGVLVVNVNKNLEQGSEQTAKMFVESTVKAPLLSYRMNVGDYPNTAEGLKALVEQPAGKARWKGPYFEKAAQINDPWGRPYQYRYPGEKNKGSFDVWSMGQDGQSGTADDIGNW
jgi:general secretion pathway protein G